MIERPALRDVRDALEKGERFADMAENTPDTHFESVIYATYFAMFHAARAALLAVRGQASTSHGRVAASLRTLHDPPVGALAEAYHLYVRAHDGNQDLTERGRALRAQMRPFVALCAGLVGERADA